MVIPVRLDGKLKHLVSIKQKPGTLNFSNIPGYLFHLKIQKKATAQKNRGH